MNGFKEKLKKLPKPTIALGIIISVLVSLTAVMAFAAGSSVVVEQHPSLGNSGETLSGWGETYGLMYSATSFTVNAYKCDASGNITDPAPIQSNIGGRQEANIGSESRLYNPDRAKRMWYQINDIPTDKDERTIHASDCKKSENICFRIELCGVSIYLNTETDTIYKNGEKRRFYNSRGTHRSLVSENAVTTGAQAKAIWDQNLYDTDGGNFTRSSYDSNNFLSHYDYVVRLIDVNDTAYETPDPQVTVEVSDYYYASKTSSNYILSGRRNDIVKKASELSSFNIYANDRIKGSYSDNEIDLKSISVQGASYTGDGRNITGFSNISGNTITVSFNWYELPTPTPTNTPVPGKVTIRIDDSYYNADTNALIETVSRTGLTKDVSTNIGTIKASDRNTSKYYAGNTTLNIKTVTLTDCVVEGAELNVSSDNSTVTGGTPASAGTVTITFKYSVKIEGPTPIPPSITPPPTATPVPQSGTGYSANYPKAAVGKKGYTRGSTSTGGGGASFEVAECGFECKNYEFLGTWQVGGSFDSRMGNYVFDNDSDHYVPGELISVGENKTIRLNAMWIAKTFTVTYDYSLSFIGGSSGLDKGDAGKGITNDKKDMWAYCDFYYPEESRTYNNPTPSKYGYTFLGWSTMQNTYNGNGFTGCYIETGDTFGHPYSFVSSFFLLKRDEEQKGGGLICHQSVV